MRSTGGFGGGLGVQLTPLVRRALVVLVGVYVAQLVLQGWLHLPVDRWFFLWPLRSGGWLPWQPVTCLLVNTPSPLSAFLEWLFLFFLAGPVQGVLGTRRFVRACLFSTGVAMGATLLLDTAGALPAALPYAGLNPLIVALLALFGLSLPRARILLFFVIPIQAGWVAWATGLLSLLYFLASRDLGSAGALGGWVGAWLWLWVDRGGIRRLGARRRARSIERDLERFHVIPGGRSGDDDDWVH